MNGQSENNSSTDSGEKSFPLVAICIVNWNGWRDTLECLESVRKLEYPNYVAVVVDNGSTDGSAENIKAWAEQKLGAGQALAVYSQSTALNGGEQQMERALDCTPSAARLVLIRNEDNQGFTGGNNSAIHYALHREAAAEYVFLVNNDATPNADCLTLLVSADLKTKAGIVGAVVLRGDGNEVEFAKSGPPLALFFAPIIKAYVPMPEDGKDSWESGYVNGAAMLIRRDVLEAVHRLGRGYLDDRLFLYWDELAFCNNARKMGFKCLVVRNATVRHKGGKSSGGFVNPIYYYYSGRNRILLVREFLPLRWRIVFHFIHAPMRLASALNNLRARRRQSAQAILLGLIDGYRGVTGKWKSHG
jgi:GT2 family glycosyltransferase